MSMTFIAQATKINHRWWHNNEREIERRHNENDHSKNVMINCL